MSEFVDARLYMTVRPPLEYMIPETASCVVRFILGEVSLANVNNALDKCLIPSCERILTNEPHSRSNKLYNEIRQHCSITCSHTQEYLRLLSHVWVEHIHRISSLMRGTLKDLETKRAEAYTVYEKYKKNNPKLIAGEYKKELFRLEKELNQKIDELRNTQCPVVKRTSELEDASTELKQLFAMSYGNMSTNKLVGLKQMFEAEMQATQSEIALQFVKSLNKTCTENQ